MAPREREQGTYWVPWLSTELIAQGIPVQTPLMPAPWNPVYEDFKSEFEKCAIAPNTVLVGHSCGCSFLVRWLGETKTKVSGLVLVAPWKVSDGSASREAFYAYNIDRSIDNRVEKIVMFTADNEREDGKKSLEIFHNALKGEIISLEGRGHYTPADMGTDIFVELRDLIVSWSGSGQ